MLFSTVEFFIFLPVVYILYLLIGTKRVRMQNSLLLVASYFFYAWWDWHFLGLIFLSSLVDFYAGQKIYHAKDIVHKKILLALSITVNLGMLGVFKYYNFFAENLASAFTLLGQNIEVSSLNIILPVGISFYTFQTLSYTIDIYRNRIKPTKNGLEFFTFVCFFPQLVAGPIERASHLLPQFGARRRLESQSSWDGLRQMLWGLFKKVVIADNCALLVNDYFENYQQHSGSSLLLAAFLFSFQIYCDFSGYSDMAIGMSRLFGFNLRKNFNYPYFSRDIAEFWRRWHISLSSWFRDYLYIPIGGSRVQPWKKIRNIFIIFLVSGFWHGADWTFIIWGGLHAIYFLPLMLGNRNRTNLEASATGKLLPSLNEVSHIFLTFILTLFAWIFFRSESVGKALQIISEILSPSLFSSIAVAPFGLLILIAFMLMIEWVNREKEHALERDLMPRSWKKMADLILISAILWAIILWNPNQEIEFIYFQF